jgi:hypothetical protein
VLTLRSDMSPKFEEKPAVMPSRPSSPTPSDSSEEVILFHGRNKPATVTLPATAVISSDEDAERQFQRKVDKYRQEMRAQARSGAPPTIVNPQCPSCHHRCKWERSMEKDRVCAGDDCYRTIGKDGQSLMACHDCGLLACFTHQRKSTNHSSRSTIRGRKTGL